MPATALQSMTLHLIHRKDFHFKSSSPKCTALKIRNLASQDKQLMALILHQGATKQQQKTGAQDADVIKRGTVKPKWWTTLEMEILHL